MRAPRRSSSCSISTQRSARSPAPGCHLTSTAPISALQSPPRSPAPRGPPKRQPRWARWQEPRTRHTLSSNDAASCRTPATAAGHAPTTVPPTRPPGKSSANGLYAVRAAPAAARTHRGRRAPTPAPQPPTQPQLRCGTPLRLRRPWRLARAFARSTQRTTGPPSATGSTAAAVLRVPAVASARRAAASPCSRRTVRCPLSALSTANQPLLTSGRG